MNEQKFNKWFNVFILAGMTVCVVLSCISRFQEPDARKVLLVVSAFGALMGVISTVLSANGSIWTFLFGLIDVAIYSYILYDSKMPSQLLLHVGYFIPMEFIGFFQWRKRGATGKSAVKAQRIHGRKWLWYALLFAGVFAATFAISYFSLRATGAEVHIAKNLLDAAVTTSNIVALVMMAFAYMEQWYLWTLVNLTSIAVWTFTMLTEPQAGYAIIPLLKYTFYLINGINGIRIWHKLSRESEMAQNLEK
ncbi:MAG: nicotinamide riboside transporter PnuC [Bacteroidales bacterium]|nr:nicotinamide riboside transporter PnuC [Bacteroidales bacterium]